MNPEQRHIRLTDYVSGQLSASLQEEMEALLKADPKLRQEAHEMQEMWEMLNKTDDQEPPADLDVAFYAFLEQEQQETEKLAKVVSLAKGQNLWRDTLKYAAGLALLCGTFLIGRSTAPTKEVLVPQIVEKFIVKPQSETPANTKSNDPLPAVMMKELITLKKEMKSTKELVMLSMLKQESPSQRIKAVNFSYEMTAPDRKVLEALVRTLNQDANTNVRMAAAEALSHFGNDKRVRDALIQTLRKQQDPMLQVAVIEILVNLREKRALPEMMAISDTDQVPQFVRDKAEEGVSVLSF